MTLEVIDNHGDKVRVARHGDEIYIEVYDYTLSLGDPTLSDTAVGCLSLPAADLLASNLLACVKAAAKAREERLR